MHPPARAIWLALVLGTVVGCAPRYHAHELALSAAATQPTRPMPVKQVNKDVEAICYPPAGWKPDPLKKSSNHVHQVWISPSGDTAYGVIRFYMPLPVGQEIAFSAFMAGMKKTEGDATLISRSDDADLPGIRFVADGGLYRIRTNFIVQGFGGWAIYAGTLRKQPIHQDELDEAEQARELTVPGLDDASGK